MKRVPTTSRSCRSSRPVKVAAATLLAAALITLLAGVAPVEAHHSFAMFDKNKPTTVKGTIRKVEWMNPHAYLFIDVTGEGGATRQYAIECSSPNELKRFGSDGSGE